MGELETVAVTMGCSAIAVAAVPQEWNSLWSQCGYKVMVPLANGEGMGKFGEPFTPLGSFLLENMLLFMDSPLMAKIFEHRGDKCDFSSAETCLVTSSSAVHAVLSTDHISEHRWDTRDVSSDGT